MTTNTTPPPPAPVSTFAGIVSPEVGELDADEKMLIHLRRLIKRENGLDLSRMDKKALVSIETHFIWRGMGDNWIGIALCRDGHITYHATRPTFKKTA